MVMATVTSELFFIKSVLVGRLKLSPPISPIFRILHVAHAGTDTHARACKSRRLYSSWSVVYNPIF